MAAKYLVLTVSGVRFRFTREPGHPELLHIFARHRMEPKHAIWAWFNGQFVWNSEHDRFEGGAGDVWLFWNWVDPQAQSTVRVISCFDATR